MAQIHGSWCPIRSPQMPGARVACEDTCALYITSSKLPPTHSCALTAIGIYALQRIVVPRQEKGTPPPEDVGGPGTGDEL